MKNQRAPAHRNRVFKWLAIGTVAMFAVIFTLGISTVWRLSPRIQSDALDETGDESVDSTIVKLIRIPFNTAKLEIKTTDSGKIEWACQTLGGARPSSEITAGVMNFHLEGLNLGKCQISIPRGIASEFQGINGQVEVRGPQDAIKISLINGKVNIKLDPKAIYDFDVKVTNGLKDFFPRSANKQAVKVKVDVVNGLVNKR